MNGAASESKRTLSVCRVQQTLSGATRRAALLIVCLALLPLPLRAGGKDDFGTWVELSARKVLPRNFTVGVEGDLRTRENSSKMNRLDIGADVGYKVNKYLKVGVAYSFIDGYKDAKGKKKYRDDGSLKNYKLTHAYWRPKHEFCLDVSPTVRLFRTLRLTVRERYQYTHKKGVTLERDKYKYDLGYEEWSREDDPKRKAAENTHTLRSRLKLEIDKKRLDWKPFVSAEAKNYFRHMKLSGVRCMAGTDYKINGRNSVSVAYVLTCDREDHERTHALSAGYEIKF